MSPYLNLPLLPLAMVLPRLLAQTEAELADEKLGAVEEERLRQRVELIRCLLTPSQIT